MDRTLDGYMNFIYPIYMECINSAGRVSFYLKMKRTTKE